MSAREAENGFMPGRFVSSHRPRRNIRGKNKNDFNMRKIGGFQIGNSSGYQETIVVPAFAATTRLLALTLVAGRREQIAATADGADHGGLGRVDLDLAPDPHDPKVDRAVE